jgi:hypothetical protein
MRACEIVMPKPASASEVRNYTSSLDALKADLAARLVDAGNEEELRKTVNEFCLTVGPISKLNMKEFSHMISVREKQLVNVMITKDHKLMEHVYFTVVRWVSSCDVWLADKNNKRTYGETIYDLENLRLRLTEKCAGSFIHINDALICVDRWLNSDKVKVSDNSLVLKCEPFSLFNRLSAL